MTLADALLRDPQQPRGWWELAEQLVVNPAKLDAAIRAYRTSLALSPAPLPGLLHRLSQALLLRGELQEGFQLYEQRPWRPWFAPFEQRLGAAAVTKRQLLLISEQGLGDTLHFLRYAEALQQQGHRVLLLCQPQLVGLIRSMSPLKQVLGFWDPTVPVPPDRQMDRNWGALEGRLGDLNAWDWAPLMSLPALLGHSRHLPLQKGLRANAAQQQRQTRWRQRLGCRPGHRLLGLTWQGNTAVEHLPEMRGRSLPFHSWLELLPSLQMPHPWEVLILQKGEALPSEIQQLPLVRGQAEYTPVHNFEDTAAVLRCCDLVLSCDTVIAHLTGNLQVPCWLALKQSPDWRWGLHHERTPLYPSLRLFRQSRPGDWDGVVASIRQAMLQPNS